LCLAIPPRVATQPIIGADRTMLLQPPAARGRRILRTAWRAWTGPARAYALATFTTGAALVVSLFAFPLDSDDSVGALLFLAAVGVSGWYGGLRPALLSTVLGALAIDYFFEFPRYMLQITNIRTFTDLLSFLLVAVLLGSLNARLRAERDRAHAALSARDELMASVSHELRTPLTAIKASVYSLRDQSMQLSMDTRQRLLSNIEAEADRLIRFVTEALALRRLENGLSPHWELSAPGEVASAVLDRCLPALGPRPIHFSIDDLASVRIDASLVDQALTVLLENVAVHTPRGTALNIEGGIVGRDLRLTVSDAGPGVPADARERVFAKYERLDHTSPGVGLGLAIARAAVEAQGGRLSVEDSALGGACFVLVIPNALETRSPM
jgi:two-component system, OmpR family, sensor histidine kinase KdpD